MSAPSSSGTDHGCATSGAPGWHLADHPEPERHAKARCTRRRTERTGQRVVVLVALGFWNEGSGRRELLDGEIATSEEQTEWEKVLTRLWERGVRPERGVQMVMRDGRGG